jgi:hypothetical protein
MTVLDASIYYTRMRTHLRFVYLHCVKHFTVRRFFIGMLYFLTVTIIGILNSVTRFIDEILFPNYKSIVIRQPVFIISNPRSGTTFLHRVMCMDEDKFVYNILYQTIFPSITFYRMIQFFYGADKKIGRPLYKLLLFINSKMFGGWDDIHATGFNKSEEDEGLHFISGISPSVGLVTPFLKAFRELYIPDRLDEVSKEQIKKFYKRTIQRWMYALGSDKLFLAKTVMSSGRLQMLHDLFPDVKIIFLIRNPYKAIPSFTSMFAEPWTVLHPDIPKKSDAYREWGELGMEYYKYFDEQKNNFRKEDLITVPYTDLVSDPKATVERIYDQLKLEMTPPFSARLEKETNRASHYSSKHSYTLEEYGFDKERIYSELKFIFDEYGFEK